MKVFLDGERDVREFVELVQRGMSREDEREIEAATHSLRAARHRLEAAVAGARRRLTHRQEQE